MGTGALRVLYVHHTTMYGGAEGSLLCLLRHLPPDLVSPILACPPGGLLNQPGIAGSAEVYPLEPWQPRFSLTPWSVKGQMCRLTAMAGAIAGLAKRTGAQLIHANSWPCAMSAVSDRSHRLPVLWHVRDLQIRSPVTWWLRSRCSAEIAISRVVERFLLERGFSPDRVSVVYNGIDATELRLSREPAAVRDELGVSPSAPVVISIAQLVPWKRHELMLQAAREVLDIVPAARFLFVGGDSVPGDGRQAHLQTEARRLGIADAVLFVGYRTDPLDLLNASDVFWHAAEAEPLGRSVLEAMALGKPVVVPASAGPGELVTHGATGLLVAPGDAHELGEGVVRMLADTDFSSACARAARQRVVSEFSAEAMAEGTVAVYRRLLEG